MSKLFSFLFSFQNLKRYSFCLQAGHIADFVTSSTYYILPISVEEAVDLGMDQETAESRSNQKGQLHKILKLQSLPTNQGLLTFWSHKVTISTRTAHGTNV